MANDIVLALASARRGHAQLTTTFDSVRAKRELQIALAKLATADRERIYEAAAKVDGVEAASIVRVLAKQDAEVKRLERRGWLSGLVSQVFAAYGAGLVVVGGHLAPSVLDEIGVAALFFGLANNHVPTGSSGARQGERLRDAVTKASMVERTSDLVTRHRQRTTSIKSGLPVSPGALEAIIAADFDRAWLACFDGGVDAVQALDQVVASGKFDREVDAVVRARDLERTYLTEAMRAAAPFLRQSAEDAEVAAHFTSLEELQRIERLTGTDSDMLAAGTGGLAVAAAITATAALGIASVTTNPAIAIAPISFTAGLAAMWWQSSKVSGELAGHVELITEKAARRREAEAVLGHVLKAEVAQQCPIPLIDHSARRAVEMLVAAATPTKALALPPLAI